MVWVESASFDAQTEILTVEVAQGRNLVAKPPHATLSSKGQQEQMETCGLKPFELDLPIRVHFEEGEENLIAKINSPVEIVSVPFDDVPVSVEMDPDYHVLRRVPAEELVPTAGTTFRGSSLVIVIPPEATEAERAVASHFEEQSKAARKVRVVPGEVARGQLAESSVLIVGRAARDSVITAFLRAVEFPVQWEESGFRFDSVRYDSPAHAVLCTIHHPGQKNAGVTLVFAHSEEAYPKAANLLMYDRSLILFQDRTPIVREDFEPRRVIPVRIRN
jgi:hypothetical protein